MCASGFIGFGFHALLHRAQVEKQFALCLGGSHLDHAPVLQDVLVNFGLDPVHGVAHQAHALVGIEALHGFHQADVAFLNEVGVGQAIAQILTRY